MIENAFVTYETKIYKFKVKSMKDYNMTIWTVKELIFYKHTTFLSHSQYYMNVIYSF